MSPSLFTCFPAILFEVSEIFLCVYVCVSLIASGLFFDFKYARDSSLIEKKVNPL